MRYLNVFILPNYLWILQTIFRKKDVLQYVLLIQIVVLLRCICVYGRRLILGVRRQVRVNGMRLCLRVYGPSVDAS